jgi:alpha-mannosidase
MTEQLGQLIRGADGRHRYFVFNPLGWGRTDVADLPYPGNGPVHVVRVGSGDEVPSQPVEDPAGRPVLRILASDIPPVGYAVFEIRHGPGQRFSDAATIEGQQIENEFYRLRVAGNGAIDSLIDKTRDDRQVVASIDGRLVNDLGSQPDGHIEVVQRGPVCVALRAVSDRPLKHETRITVTRGSRRINIHNEILQNFGGVHYWKHSFAVQEPLLRHEELGAILTARLVSQGGHYSDHNARYDHLTLNHFADVSGGDFGVTLSNADCSFVRWGRSTIRELDTNTPQLSVLAGGRIDGPGFPDQGGDERFVQRFALATHGGYDPYDAMRFALEHQNPLSVGKVTPAGRYPAQQGALMKALPRGLVLWSIKPAEAGMDHGVIARIWNVSEQATAGRLHFALPIRAVSETSHIETDMSAVDTSDNRLSLRAGPWQMRTWRLHPN